MNELFDLSAEYEAMLNRGIRYSGESMEYFLAGRLARVEACLGAGTGRPADFLILVAASAPDRVPSAAFFLMRL